ncbi:MAG: DNA polymerase IV [Candidatus Aenigmarchaeota archaeon]|nr:DNA polymerase IV [Candidatus Aenigmarchaeota archaeon]
MHIDFDAFYPSVEERERPEWKGRPVIVGADPRDGKGRGVVASANYIAREFGVRSAMPISRAWKLCPHGIYLRPNLPLYVKVSYDAMSIIRKYSEKFQQLSIDEAFIDVTGKVKDFEEAGDLAEKLKREILTKEQIGSSIGIGPNKLIAKLASDYRKPYGLTIVKPEDSRKFLSPLPVRKLIGIGPKTEAALKEMKIDAVEQLAKVDVKILTEVFGKFGYRMHEMALGIDDSDVSEEGEIKSIGKELTFEEDVDDPQTILQALVDLIEEFHPELSSSGMQFKTVNLKVRYENFETHTRANTLGHYSNDMETIKKVARNLIQPFLDSGRKVRLVGVRVSGLRFGKNQKTLKEL